MNFYQAIEHLKDAKITVSENSDYSLSINLDAPVNKHLVGFTDIMDEKERVDNLSFFIELNELRSKVVSLWVPDLSEFINMPLDESLIQLVHNKILMLENNNKMDGRTIYSDMLFYAKDNPILNRR